jgi:4-hydroxy-tetrahydrodipicolinate reductase
LQGKRARNCFEKDENNTYEGLSTADVAIDFSVPTAAVSNISIVFLCVLSGTTGWLEQYDEMVALCTAKALSISSNFSLGVIFFEINEYLAIK